jgi:hypothetical protein
MNNDHLSHPYDEELLLYLDGELDNTSSESTRRHLNSCWTCRMRASNIQTAILEYTRERERLGVPEPPSPWKDLDGEFQRIQDSVQAPSLLKRIGMGSFFKGGRVAMFVAATTALAAMSWFVWPKGTEKSSVEAPKIQPVAPEVSHPTSGVVEPPSTRPLKAEPHTILPEPHKATVHEELAIASELHRLKADLGEPIELARVDNELVLNVSGLGRDRTGEIRKAVARFADLRLQFSEPTTNGRVQPDSESRTSARRPIAFEQELTTYAGGRQYLEQLANSILDASDRIAMYAHALDKLDHRFAGSVLNGEDEALFNQIRQDHRTGSRQALQSLRNLMDPIFGALGIEAKPAPEVDLVGAAVQTDRLLNAAFAGAQSDLDDHELYSELRGWIARLSELLN